MPGRQKKTGSGVSGDGGEENLSRTRLTLSYFSSAMIRHLDQGMEKEGFASFMVPEG